MISNALPFWVEGWRLVPEKRSWSRSLRFHDRTNRVRVPRRLRARSDRFNVSLPMSLKPRVGPMPESGTLDDPSHAIGIEHLFRAHAPAIASLGLSMLQSRAEADDLVQDVFVRAWRAVDRLENPRDAKPWLMTIAIRLARTRLRRRKLSRLLFRGDPSEIPDVPTVAAVPEHRDLVRRLYAVLEELPVELHLAWVLRHVQAESVEDIAILCGWSLSTAKRRIQEAHSRVTSRLHALTGGRS
jgi:RNA polymerase sigma-70 factor (ECF subfamily)